MKKILSLLLAVIMVVSAMSITAFAANANGSLTVTADQTSVQRGDIVNYTVYLDDCSAFSGGVYNVEFTLSIPEGLEFQNGSIDSNFSTATGILSMDFNANACKVSGLGALAAGYTGGQAAVLNFSCKVADDASGSLTVGLTGVVLTNEAGAAVTPTVNGTSVSVEVPHVCAPEAVAEIPAACTEDGVKAHYACECGKLYADAAGETEVTAADLVIKAAGHSAGAWTETKAPTCTEKGTETRTCTKCGETETREVSATGHSYDDGVVTREAACTAEGEKTCTCTACGETKVEKIEALGHSAKEGVWKSDGQNHWQECETCGEKLESVKHTGGKATTEKKAVCEICGAEYGELAAAADKDDSQTTDNPETGDDSHVVLWLALLLIAMFGMAAAAVIRKKHA